MTEPEEEQWNHSDPLGEAARNHLKVNYLYPYQRLVVANTLDAAESTEAEVVNQIVVLPTGSGKTLCFSLPAWMLPGTTLVVYPLLALMKDQARRAAEFGLQVAVLRGGLARAERKRLLEGIRRDQYDIVITNPETLAVQDVRAALVSCTVDHLVIDEAHCVSEWGESFRPAYLELRSAMDQIHPKVTTAFTATASDPILESVRRLLFADNPVRIVRANPDRPNISYAVIAGHCKPRILRSLFTAPSVPRPAIVFCRSRVRTEEVARTLAGTVAADDLAAYHAGLTAQTRATVEDWFFASQAGVLVSTCAYGMGVDKPNIRCVIHYDPPASVEAFLQESGRAGRDRMAAVSVLLVGPQDYATAGSSPRYDIMLRYAADSGCRRSFLMERMGAESESCFGCDSCTPRQLPAALSRAQTEDRSRVAKLLRTVRRNPRRFSADDLIAAADWTTAERELVESLLVTGALRSPAGGLWRGRVVAS